MACHLSFFSKSKVLATSLLVLCTLSFSGIAQTSDPAVLFFKNGEAFRAQKKYNEAIEEYQKAINIDGTRPQIYFWQASCYFSLDEHSKGIDILEKALEVDPNYTQVYSALLKGYSETANTSKVVETLSRMAKSVDDPLKEIEYYNRIANILVKQRSYAEALQYISDGLKADPNNMNLLYAKAQSLNGVGDYQGTLSSIKPVLGKIAANDRENNTRFNYEVGYAYYKMTKYNEANSYFKRAYSGPYKALISKLQPNHFFNVAYGFSMIYEYDTTEKMLEKALAVDPAFAKAYDLLADIAIKQEHHHKGIMYYEKAVAGLADQDDYLDEIYESKLIPTLINAREYREAVRICDQASAKFPFSRNIKYLKAIALHHQDLNADAITIMENIISEPGLPALERSLYSFALGIMYKAHNDWESAKSSFKEARTGAFTNASLHAYEQMLEEESLAQF